MILLAIFVIGRPLKGPSALLCEIKRVHADHISTAISKTYYK